MTNEEMLRRLREIRSDYDDDIKKYGMLKGYLDDAEALDNAISIIEEFLSAQPERKTGRWIVKPAPDKYHAGEVMYPFCKTELIAEPDEYLYCPTCGARLEGET